MENREQLLLLCILTQEGSRVGRGVVGEKPRRRMTKISIHILDTGFMIPHLGSFQGCERVKANKPGIEMGAEGTASRGAAEVAFRRRTIGTRLSWPAPPHPASPPKIRIFGGEEEEEEDESISLFFHFGGRL
jgi:hypothetical protein